MMTNDNCSMSLFAFGRHQRLLSSRQYQFAFSHVNEKNQGRYWRLLSTINGLGYARLGTSIGRKILKRAVDRNRFKRIARELFRQNQQKIAHKDFIVMLNRGQGNMRQHSNQTLHAELLTLLQKHHKNQ